MDPVTFTVVVGGVKLYQWLTRKDEPKADEKKTK